YDLKNFTLQELEKLENFTIQNFIDNKCPSSTTFNKNGNEKSSLPGFTLENSTTPNLKYKYCPFTSPKKDND
ncbi:16821_t:CDS:1, partial [Funneliformis caledonium]